MIGPGDLSGHADLHMFKEGIKPMWEVRNHIQKPALLNLKFDKKGRSKSERGEMDGKTQKGTVRSLLGISGKYIIN